MDISKAQHLYVMIKIENFLYEVGEIFIFCLVNFKLVENLEKKSKILYLIYIQIVPFCKAYSCTTFIAEI